MNHDRLEQLWMRLLGGAELAPSEEQELREALERDPELRDRLLEDAETDGYLRAFGDSRDDAAFSRQFGELLSAEREGSAFVGDLRHRLKGRRAPAGKRTRRFRPVRDPGASRTVAIFAAAAVLFGLVLYGAISSGNPARPATPGRSPEVTTTPPEGAPEPVVRVVEPEVKRLPTEPQGPRVPRPEDPPRASPEERRAPAEAPRRGVEEPKKDPPPRAEPADPTPPRPPQETRPAVAKLEQVEGEVFVLEAGTRSAARTGLDLLKDSGVEVLGPASRAVVMFPDKTRIELKGDVAIRDLLGSPGKRLFVARGALAAEISKQPKDQPMVFATPHGEARVLGTTLRLVVDSDPTKGTRLDVEEGKVQLKNLATQRTVLVESGHYAVAATGAELVSRLLPVDEIVLLPRPGTKIAGSDWTLVKDAESPSGYACEAVAVQEPKESFRKLKGGAAGFVEFRFLAEAKEYHVWVRGSALPKAPQSMSVCLVLPGGRWNAPGWENVDGGFFNGWKTSQGYWWVGGDVAKDLGFREEVLLTVRFDAPGPRTLRLYPIETPLRIDAIWLSATRKSRPDPRQGGPK